MMDEINSGLEQLDPNLNYYNSIHDSLNLPYNPEYMTIAQYNTINRNSPKLTIITYNIRSFNKNINTFMASFNSNQKTFPEVLILTETWFDVTTVCNLPGYDAHHTVREGTRSGGISIFIRDDLNSNFYPKFSFANNTIEICTIDVTVNNFSLTVIGIYIDRTQIPLKTSH